MGGALKWAAAVCGKGGTHDNSAFVEEFRDLFDHPDPEPIQVGLPCSSPEDTKLKIYWVNIMLLEEPPHLAEWVAS